MNQDQLVEKIVVALRSQMNLDARLPKGSYANIMTQAENLADEIKAYDPVAQEILINLCTRSGSQSFQQGHPFELFKAEAVKMAEELRAHEKQRDEKRGVSHDRRHPAASDHS